MDFDEYFGVLTNKQTPKSNAWTLTRDERQSYFASNSNNNNSNNNDALNSNNTSNTNSNNNSGNSGNSGVCGVSNASHIGNSNSGNGGETRVNNDNNSNNTSGVPNWNCFGTNTPSYHNNNGNHKHGETMMNINSNNNNNNNKNGNKLTFGSNMNEGASQGCVSLNLDDNNTIDYKQTILLDNLLPRTISIISHRTPQLSGIYTLVGLNVYARHIDNQSTNTPIMFTKLKFDEKNAIKLFNKYDKKIASWQILCADNNPCRITLIPRYPTINPNESYTICRYTGSAACNHTKVPSNFIKFGASRLQVAYQKTQQEIILESKNDENKEIETKEKDIVYHSQFGFLNENYISTDRAMYNSKVFPLFVNFNTNAGTVLGIYSKFGEYQAFVECGSGKDYFRNWKRMKKSEKFIKKFLQCINDFGDKTSKSLVNGISWLQLYGDFDGLVTLKRGNQVLERMCMMHYKNDNLCNEFRSKQERDNLYQNYQNNFVATYPCCVKKHFENGQFYQMYNNGNNNRNGELNVFKFGNIGRGLSIFNLNYKCKLPGLPRTNLPDSKYVQLDMKNELSPAFVKLNSMNKNANTDVNVNLNLNLNFNLNGNADNGGQLGNKNGTNYCLDNKIINLLSTFDLLCDIPSKSYGVGYNKPSDYDRWYPRGTVLILGNPNDVFENNCLNSSLNYYSRFNDYTNYAPSGYRHSLCDYGLYDKQWAYITGIIGFKAFAKRYNYNTFRLVRNYGELTDLTDIYIDRKDVKLQEMRNKVEMVHGKIFLQDRYGHCLLPCNTGHLYLFTIKDNSGAEKLGLVLCRICGKWEITPELGIKNCSIQALNYCDKIASYDKNGNVNGYKEIQQVIHFDCVRKIINRVYNSNFQSYKQYIDFVNKQYQNKLYQQQQQQQQEQQSSAAAAASGAASQQNEFVVTEKHLQDISKWADSDSDNDAASGAVAVAGAGGTGDAGDAGDNDLNRSEIKSFLENDDIDDDDDQDEDDGDQLMY